MSQLALVHVALWCFGEFGEHLLVDCAPPPLAALAGADGAAGAPAAEQKPFSAHTVAAVRPRGGSSRHRGGGLTLPRLL